MPRAFQNSGVGARILQDIAAARSVAVDNTGNLAKSRYERLLGELLDLLNQATRIQIEILNAMRGQLNQEIANEQSLTAQAVERATGKILLEIKMNTLYNLKTDENGDLKITQARVFLETHPQKVTKLCEIYGMEFNSID